MRILIDTHFVLWTALNPSEMAPWAHRLLADLKNEILVSSASVYEISLKVRLGKLPEAAEFEGDLLTNIEEKLGFVLLPLDPQSMYRAARFEHKHADPFDRMIAAQAIQYDLPLLSVDPKLDSFGIRKVKKPVGLP
jgi:PIN domain nuclease of toxin-antitoxin system